MQLPVRIAIVLFFATFATGWSQSVVINEVMSSNTNTLQDEDGAYSDWVELYNADVNPVDLTGWGLSDSYATPFKWRFGAVTLQPGEFLLVWASSKDRPAITNGNMLHTSFAISKGGEEVVLTRASDSNRVDELVPTALADNQSIGRQPDGTGTWYYFSTATPAAANTTTGIAAALPAPVFSMAGGSYTSAIDLSFSTTVTGGVIRYTLDGSEPTTSSPAFGSPLNLASRNGETNNLSLIPTNQGLDPGPPFYEGWQAPLGEVFKFHTVRARVFKSGAVPSRTVTQSYLIDTNGNHRYTLPIISVVSAASNFFSNATGIYVPGWYDNYNQEGDAWERPGSVEMIDTNGLVAFRFDAGFRIHGGSTRNRPRKTLRVYARNPSTLDYPLFPDKNITRYDTFILRNGGNDWGQSIFRDAYLQSLVSHTTLDRQSAQPAVVFINGEYWGVHHLRDRFDDGYIENHYGLGEQEFVQLETGWEAPNNSLPIYDRGNTNLVADYYDLLNFVNQQGVVSTANYAAVQDRMDVDNYLDYLAAELWSGNTDWPGNNMRLWRSASTNREPNAPFRHDGRWRWMLYDTDFGLGLDFFYVPGHDAFASFNSLQHATAANGAEFSNNTNATLLLRRLLANDDFKRSLVTRLSDHLNSSFRTDRVQQQFTSTVARLAPEMAEHARRWQQPFNWSNEVARIASYIGQRTPAMWGHLQSTFSLNNRTTLTVRVNDEARGHVQLNSLTLKAGTPGVGSPAYPWSGSYFPNYPVRLTALPEPGFRFVAWRRVFSTTNTILLSTNITFSISVTNATEMRADFEPDLTGVVPQPHDLASGPFSFTAWSSTETAGTYPPNMVFEQTATLDPALTDAMDSFWTLPYNLASRSRINGLNSDGVAFINSGNAQTNAGAGFLGSAVAALTTLGRTNLLVSWTAGTVTTNVRVQGLRLQYRVGASGPFMDVLDEASQPVEYLRNDVTGHSTNLAPVKLPPDAENQLYVQLRWKYYWVSGDSGARAQLRLDDILVTSQGAVFAPVANAGDDQEISLAGGPVALDGSASADSDGSISNVWWSQLAGPSVTLDNPTSTVLAVSIPAQPTNTLYTFQLVVTDNDGLSATDTVSVVQAPISLIATYPQMYFRGTPNGWSTSAMTLVSNYVWEITATFGSSDPKFKFDVYGDWSLNFGDYEPNGIADQDTGGYSDISVTEGAGDYRIRFHDQTRQYWVTKFIPNQAPVANAGANQIFNLAGRTVSLDGSASYDPDGTIASYLWTQTAGPAAQLDQTTSSVASVTLAARATPVTNRFKLVVNDAEGLSATATVSVVQGLSYTGRNARMYFRGTPNNWSTNHPMTLVSNNLWEIRVEFGSTANERFKFDATPTWALNYGDNDLDGYADLAGNNIPVTNGPGLYLVRFDDLTTAYTATPLTGTFVSAHAQLSLSGAFNQWALPPNLHLVGDHLWRGVIPLYGAQTLKFVATGNWAQAWGDLQGPEYQTPVTGVAEPGAPMMVITSALAGIYQVTFHENTGVYRLESMSYRAGTTNVHSDWEQLHGLNLQSNSVREADDDGDGLNNLGEAQHGTDPGMADSDGDGQCDGDEVVAATDPNASASRFELTPLGLAGLQWPGATGRTYRVEALQDLEAQDWQPVGGQENRPGANGLMEAPLETSREQQQMRVRIIGVNYQPGSP